MQTILLDDFIDDGIIKEKSFRAKVDEMDFDKFVDQFTPEADGSGISKIQMVKVYKRTQKKKIAPEKFKKNLLQKRLWKMTLKISLLMKKIANNYYFISENYSSI